MKIIILSTATGQGHNSAAAAVSGYLEAQGCEVVVVDVLKSGKKNASRPVSGLYENLVMHTPGLFGALYKAGDLISSSRVHSPIYYLNSIYAPGLYEKLLLFSPDAVICTHLFSAQALTYLKMKKKFHVPSVGVVTDYTCSPFWEETRLNKYVIPSPYLLEEFVKKGIPREKLEGYGIPVGDRFRSKTPKEQARLELGLPDGRLFVIMGGSMGFGLIPLIAKALLDKMPDAHVAVICGNNKKLFSSIEAIKGVLPVAYTENVDLFMDAADVLLTKPGGLSATEATVKRVPIVFTCAIPGCEDRNIDFFVSRGMALFAQKPHEAAEAAIKLIGDEKLCSTMLIAQEKYINRFAQRDIGNLTLDLSKAAMCGSDGKCVL